VVADFGGDGVLSVLVANDMTANHLYVNEAHRGELPRFVERATLAGLAFDGNGYSQACMGIAIDDVDTDGRLDVFFTNYLNEPNTLYRGHEAENFADATRSAGLHEPSLLPLGFGTEFLDADLDGDCDLVVANGHVVDDGPGGTDFQMRPQFFENTNGRFTECSSSDLGPYFDRELLGRSLACLDFDRDGRPDFLVSHLDAPVALLHNEAESPGHFLAIHLRGVAGSRDAIGATVTVFTAGSHRYVRQLTAGDGYMCSNERQLVFGLGDAAVATKVMVQWPSGTVQESTDVLADRHWTIVEGREEFFEVSH
jgi:hypothetical protein